MKKRVFTSLYIKKSDLQAIKIKAVQSGMPIHEWVSKNLAKESKSEGKGLNKWDYRF